jgi:hypothetical protein
MEHCDIASVPRMVNGLAGQLILNRGDRVYPSDQVHSQSLFSLFVFQTGRSLHSNAGHTGLDGGQCFLEINVRSILRLFKLIGMIVYVVLFSSIHLIT